MKINLFYKIVFFIFIFFGILQSLVWPESLKNEGLTTEQMLQYTLLDLHNRMQEIVKNNNNLSSQIQDFQKKLIPLSQDMSQLENEKIHMMEESLELNDLIKLEAEELFSIQQKMKILEQEQRTLTDQQINLNKAIDNHSQRQDTLKQNSVLAEKEFSELQSLGVHKKLLDYREEYRIELNNMIQVLEVRREKMLEIQKRIPVLKKELERFSQVKDKLINKQVSYKQQLLELGAFTSPSLLIKENPQENRKETKILNEQELLKAQQDFFKLKTYYEQLYALKENLRDINKENRRKARNNQSMTERAKVLLQEEQSCLKGIDKTVRHSFQLKKGLRNSIQNNKSISDDLQQITKRNAELQRIYQENKKNLLEQKRIQNEYLLKEKALVANIRELKKDARYRSKNKQLLVKEKQKKMKHMLGQKLSAKEKQQRQIANKFSLSKKELKQMNKKLIPFQKENHSFLEELNAESSSLQKFLEEEKQLRNKIDKLKGPKNDNRQAVVDEIDFLKMRKKVLNDSLSIIQSRYDANAIVIEDFQSQKKKLNEYLSIIKLENANLKEKVVKKLSTLGKIKKEKGFLATQENKDTLNQGEQASE